jgi:fructoselysine 6-kinase
MSASNNTPPTVLVGIGDCCVDEYAVLGIRTVGGNAVNVAVNCARAGLASAYLGAVGPDPEGRFVLDSLAHAGVDTSRVVTLPGRTGITKIEITDGERRIAAEDLGVAVDYRPTDADIAGLHSVVMAHCVALTDFRGTVRRLAERGIRVSYDFSTRHEFDRLDGIDTAFYSWEAPPDEAAREVIRHALSEGARTVVVTCGAHGSLAGRDGAIERVPAQKVLVRDSCGAGDSYIAGFLRAELQGRPLRECMEAGTAAAAETCRHLGAWPQPLALDAATFDRNMTGAAHEL